MMKTAKLSQAMEFQEKSTRELLYQKSLSSFSQLLLAGASVALALSVFLGHMVMEVIPKAFQLASKEETSLQRSSFDTREEQRRYDKTLPADPYRHHLAYPRRESSHPISARSTESDDPLSPAG